jgi:hypothetical protein
MKRFVSFWRHFKGGEIKMPEQKKIETPGEEHARVQAEKKAPKAEVKAEKKSEK